MKRIGVLPLLCLPALGLAQPQVEEVSYHYLEAGFVDADIDVPGGEDLSGDGYGFEYSVDVRDHVHLFGAYERFDIEDIDGDATRKLFGLGTHWGLTDKLSVYGRFAYTDVALDVGTGNVGDDGAAVMGGVRYLFDNGWEVRAGAEHVDLDDGGTETYYTVGGNLFLTDIVALSLDVDDRDGDMVALLGLRFYWDNDPGPRRRR
ncbi:MAG: outer membrane beta-barrel protein [Gammaproteobacteria bacterium]|nr:outer membrane beta-barrel protein [Gammaproteobacteria bacterium]